MGGVVVAPFPNPTHYGWTEEQATDFALRELDYILQTITPPNETAAFFVEPVLGEGGYVPANAEFLAGLRERADRHGILLVVDEVQTGFGRTGRFWGHDHFGVVPDVLITAKGLASGFPLSAIAASQDLMSRAWPGSQGGTYGGNPIACAAALATIETMRELDLNAAARHIESIMLPRLHALAERDPRIGDVRGRGAMLAIETVAAGCPRSFENRLQQIAGCRLPIGPRDTDNCHPAARMPEKLRSQVRERQPRVTHDNPGCRDVLRPLTLRHDFHTRCHRRILLTHASMRSGILQLRLRKRYRDRPAASDAR